jgi:glycosyltransferase involved in cell wall biosynthesis
LLAGFVAERLRRDVLGERSVNQPTRPSDEQNEREAGARAAGGRICIVTGELAGPDFNGGIGTANRGLAFALSDRGHSVDILYTRVNEGQPFSFRGGFADQVEVFARHGVRLNCIFHRGAWNDWGAKSYLVLQHLLAGDYDLVFFDDTHGHGYYPLLAKRTGNEKLQRVRFVVVTHSATQWIQDSNEIGINTIEELRVVEMERRAIELADVLIAPSAFLLGRYRRFGWRLPSQIHVQPNIVSDLAPEPRAEMRRNLSEIVFFGRLESRKGLWLFCRALDRIKYKLNDVTVTFLGKLTDEYGISSGEKLLRRASSWPFEIRVLNNYNRDQALSYLRSGSRLAVMPSFEDNSPSVVLECLENFIPFIASSGSGGEELIAPESRANCTFEPTARALAAKLLDVVGKAPVIGKAAFNYEENKANYLTIVDDILAADAPVPAAPRASEAVATLVVLVPSDFAPARAAQLLVNAFRTYRGRVYLNVLTNDPSGLYERTSSEECVEAVRFLDFESYPALCRNLAKDRESVIGVCHITQIIEPSWLARAEQAILSSQLLAAVTGISVEEVADRKIADLPGYFSVPPPNTPLSGPFPLGNAEALFCLSQETNSGFVAVRSRLLPLLSNCLPFDSQYARERLMPDWLHEILMKLFSFGESFELIPDVAVRKSLQERPLEVFRLGAAMRSLVREQLELPVGSEAWLLARLAVDTSLDAARLAAARQCIAEVGVPGLSELDWHLYEPRSTHAFKIAGLALAAGQASLATELLGNDRAAAARVPAGWNLATFVERTAKDISLAKYVAHGQIKRINLDHEWSYQDVEGGFGIHPNAANEGRAAVVLLALSLSDVAHFEGEARLDEKANPVRCRIDIVAIGRPDRVTHEFILDPGKLEDVEFDIPEPLRCDCTITFSVEMASLDDPSTGALVQWTDLVFRGDYAVTGRAT